MVKGTTSTGFNFQIPENLDQDWRFVRSYRRIENGRSENERIDAALELVSVVFSDESEEVRFYEHICALEGNNGRAPVEEVYRELGEIIKAATDQSEEIKNS